MGRALPFLMRGSEKLKGHHNRLVFELGLQVGKLTPREW
jgi:hypothetical protein